MSSSLYRTLALSVLGLLLLLLMAEYYPKYVTIFLLLVIASIVLINANEYINFFYPQYHQMTASQQVHPGANLSG